MDTTSYEKVFAVGREVYFVGVAGTEAGQGKIIRNSANQLYRGFMVDVQLNSGVVLSDVMPSSFGRFDDRGNLNGALYTFGSEYTRYTSSQSYIEKAQRIVKRIEDIKSTLKRRVRVISAIDLSHRT